FEHGTDAFRLLWRQSSALPIPADRMSAATEERRQDVGGHGYMNNPSTISMTLMPRNGTSTPPRPQMSRLRRSRASAPTGRYVTPLRATGIRSGMMRALKITADRMA